MEVGALHEQARAEEQRAGAFALRREREQILCGGREHQIGRTASAGRAPPLSRSPQYQTINSPPLWGGVAQGPGSPGGCAAIPGVERAETVQAVAGIRPVKK